MHHTTVLASLKVGRSVRTSVPPFVGMFVTPPALFQGFPPVRLRGQTLQSFEKNFKRDSNPISVVSTRFFSHFIQVPFVPFLPCLSIFLNVLMMVQLSYSSWMRFFIWMCIGKYQFLSTVLVVCTTIRLKLGS